MDFYVLIPARLESTRLENKMLQDLQGVPLVVRTAQQAQKSAAQAVYIATDNAQIAAVARAHGIDHVMTRSHETGTDRLAEAAHILDLPPDAIIVNVQGDEPLIDPLLINAVAQQLQQDTEAAMATAAAPLKERAQLFDPNIVKVVCDFQQQALYFSRAPIPWERDGDNSPDASSKGAASRGDTPPNDPPAPALHHMGIYAYRNAFLQRFPTLSPGVLERLESLEQLRALEHGETIRVHRWPKTPAPGIDTAQDLALVRQLLADPHSPL
ncbi:MAG TPA: 3-deoxy-manno-octulosonate cytidylyltransferase [Paenalcaligenes sp.]|nr:3-deoxy-manno-octulosonate cytidylyltransferase [Paenalcaligenes sp.]